MINAVHPLKGTERPLRQLLLSHKYPLLVFLQLTGCLPPSYSFDGIYSINFSMEVQHSSIGSAFILRENVEVHIEDIFRNPQHRGSVVDFSFNGIPVRAVTTYLPAWGKVQNIGMPWSGSAYSYSSMGAFYS